MTPNASPTLPSDPARPVSRRAFTLMEVLIVVCLIVIVVALTVPALLQAKEGTVMSQCNSQMHQLHLGMQGNRMLQQFSGIPPASNWISTVVSNGAGDALICPKDYDTFKTEGGLDTVSTIQWEHYGAPPIYVTVTPVKDIIAHKNPLADDQISWYTNGPIHVGNDMAGEDDLKAKLGVTSWANLPDDIIACSIDYGGRFSIDAIKGTITIYEKWQGNAQGGGSRHFIDLGNGDIVEMGGGKHVYTNNTCHQGYNPPLELNAGGVPVSYGMNGLLEDERRSGNQVLLLDYEKPIVDLDRDGNILDDFDESFAGRHFGKANVMLLDGSTQARSQAELEVSPKVWTPSF